MSELTMFVYPWDVARVGAATLVARLAEMGVTRIAVSASYHSGAILAPAETGSLVFRPDANRAHVRLATSAFTGLRLEDSAFATDAGECFGELAEHAGAAGIGLTAWGVCLHNSELAQRWPALAVRSCANDPSAHGLCPSQPRVRTYVRELVRAVMATGHFDRVLLESASSLLASHGQGEDDAAVPLDVRTTVALSLCFCSVCRDHGTAVGLDVEALRGRCRTLVNRRFASPLIAERAPDEGLELAALLAADAELAAYVRMRRDTVSELLQEIVADVHAEDGGVLACSAVGARPTPLNWAEGIDLARAGATADQLLVLTYGKSVGSVARELDHVLEHVDADRVVQLLPLWVSQHGSRDQLLAKVGVGLDAGVRAFGLYNYAMAPAALAAWTPAVSRAIAVG